MVTVANAGLDGDLLQLRGLTKAPVQRLPSTSFSASASIRSTHLFYFCFFLHIGLNWHWRFPRNPTLDEALEDGWMDGLNWETKEEELDIFHPDSSPYASK